MSDLPADQGYTRRQLRLYKRLVRPFYLKMALVEGPAEFEPRAARRVRRRLLRAGSRVTPRQVELMLRGGGWREMTMGAWLALAMPADQVRGMVLDAWNTIPRDYVGPLTTVSVLAVGPDAIPAMRSFVARSVGDDDPGTTDYLSAAIEYLGGSPPSDPDPLVAASFEDSLGIATALRRDFLARRRRLRPWGRRP